jgi:hypothetical protein
MRQLSGRVHPNGRSSLRPSRGHFGRERNRRGTATPAFCAAAPVATGMPILGMVARTLHLDFMFPPQIAPQGENNYPKEGTTDPQDPFRKKFWRALQENAEKSRGAPKTSETNTSLGPYSIHTSTCTPIR